MPNATHAIGGQNAAECTVDTRGDKADINEVEAVNSSLNGAAIKRMQAEMDSSVSKT